MPHVRIWGTPNENGAGKPSAATTSERNSMSVILLLLHSWRQPLPCHLMPLPAFWLISPFLLPIPLPLTYFLKMSSKIHKSNILARVRQHKSALWKTGNDSPYLGLLYFCSTAHNSYTWFCLRLPYPPTKGLNEHTLLLTYLFDLSIYSLAKSINVDVFAFSVCIR